MSTTGRVTTFLTGALAGAAVGWYAGRASAPSPSTSPLPTTLSAAETAGPGAGPVADPAGGPPPAHRGLGPLTEEELTAPGGAGDTHDPDRPRHSGGHGTSVADTPWAADPLRHGGGH